MRLSSLEDLVSQSEAEGVSLGELLARKASPRELDKLQSKLRSQIDAGYAKIEEFMGDVHITSVWETVGMEEPSEESFTESRQRVSDEA